MKHLTLFSVLIILNSCAFHSGIITSTPQSGLANKEYIDIAVGYSKTSYFLGFGGLSKDMLISEAKRNLILSSKIKPNQSLENVMLNMKRTIYGPYIILEAIMMADIAEHDSAFKTIYSQNYSDLMNYKDLRNNYFLLPGENILFRKNNLSPIYGKVISVDFERVKVFYVEFDGNHKIKNIPYNNVFKISDFELLQNMLGLIKKETYNFGKLDHNGYPIKGEGKIIGLNKKYALIEYEKSNYVIDINSLKVMNPK